MRQPSHSLRTVRAALAGMRPYQWLKNLLIFVPAATSHRIFHPDVFRAALLGFLSFSLCASGGYLINDLLDVEADRGHALKRNRPLASGELSKPAAVFTAALLFAGAGWLGSLISQRYLLFLGGYLALALAYSLVLKTMLVADIFVLAFFYTLRVFLGGEATGIRVSFWLAVFSTFFFFSLATIKRFNELRFLVKHSGGTVARRNYRPEDTTMLGMWGTASGCASVVVLALYINSEEVTRLYHRPSLLWPVCLAFLFWLNRIWMLANRDGLPYDPILFAVKDRASYLVAAFVVGSILLAL